MTKCSTSSGLNHANALLAMVFVGGGRNASFLTTQRGRADSLGATTTPQSCARTFVWLKMPSVAQSESKTIALPGSDVLGLIPKRRCFFIHTSSRRLSVRNTLTTLAARKRRGMRRRIDATDIIVPSLMVVMSYVRLHSPQSSASVALGHRRSSHPMYAVWFVPAIG